MCTLSVFEELAFLQRQKATNRHGTAVGWIVEDETRCQQGVVGRGSPFSDVLELKSPCFSMQRYGRLLHKRMRGVEIPQLGSNGCYTLSRLETSANGIYAVQKPSRRHRTLALRARVLYGFLSGFYTAQIPWPWSLTYTQSTLHNFDCIYRHRTFEHFACLLTYYFGLHVNKSSQQTKHQSKEMTGKKVRKVML